MGSLQSFDFENNSVRVLEINNEPWFVASDVCKVLELSNPTMAVNRLEDEERSKFNLGRQGDTNIINESGLYELIFASRKSSAKQFKKWVKQEVLPSIRKHGTYMTPETIEKVLTDPDTIIQIATQLKSEREKRVAAELVLEQQRPKVIFAESVSASKTTILVGELAKIIKQNGINIGPKRLFDWLRNNGYLIKRKGTDYNMPTQYSMELSLFEIKETSVTHSDGHISISKTPKVTGKGQVYFINKFLKGDGNEIA